MMATSSNAVVETSGVTKIFRDFWNREKVAAVTDLDLQVRGDEIYGLLGPNGSGKSTTVKMILGLLHPTRGYIRVLGQHPSNVKIKRRIGFLPEESYLYPFLSAFETLDYYGRLFRQARPVRRARVEMLLDMVGLANVAYRRVGEYSKGMQRRIGLAQALINDPDLLILDEPTSGLDPLGTRLFKDLIVDLGRRGKTVILCSHLLSDVEDVCDRVAILYGGRKRAEGDLAELLSRQDRTQIITERLGEPTVEAVRQVIAERESKQVLDVTRPRNKLENLFLDIVAEAQAQRLDTGGAVATGQVAEFLRADRAEAGRGVLDNLVAAASQAEPVDELSETESVDQPEVNVEMLDNLTTPSAEPAGAGQAEPTTEPTAPKPAPLADRGVLDSLLDTPDASGTDEDA